MAHLHEHRPGRFYLEQRKHAIYLPKINAKQRTAVLEKVERLIESRLSGEPPEPRIVKWLADVGDDLHGRLVKAGLTDARQRLRSKSLAAFLDEYIADQTSSPKTIENLERVRKHLVAHFGADRPLADITLGDADSYSRRLDKAPSTNALYLRIAKQFFRAAAWSRCVDASPFEDISPGSMKNTDRQFFVERDVFQRVLDHCPDLDTKTALALCRFGGLRHTSETFNLRFTDVDWSERRLRVDSTKTGLRYVPIFPELEPFLLAA